MKYYLNSRRILDTSCTRPFHWAIKVVKEGWNVCVAFWYFFEWNALRRQPEDEQIVNVELRPLFECSADALQHQPEDVQIVDVEFLHFFVPHTAMHHLVDENIYVLWYPDFLK